MIINHVSTEFYPDISIKREIYSNVFDGSEWPLFDKEKSGADIDTLPLLSLVSFVAWSPQGLLNRAMLDQACATSLLSLLFASRMQDQNWKAWLLVAHRNWQPKNRITLYKKLWSGFLGTEMQGFERHGEYKIESAEGARWVGLTQVTAENFLSAVRLMRRHGRALLVSQRENIFLEESARFLFCAAFPKHKGIEQGNVDLATLSLNICPLGDIAIRLSGSHDDKESSLDCVLSPEKVPLLTPHI